MPNTQYFMFESASTEVYDGSTCIITLGIKKHFLFRTKKSIVALCSVFDANSRYEIRILLGHQLSEIHLPLLYIATICLGSVDCL
jgi:hypothetical protein